MGSADEVDVVFLQELLYNLLTEGVGNASVVLTPTRLALFRVRPDYVAE